MGWALWSGFLGATASCLVKMGAWNSPLLKLIQKYISERLTDSSDPSSSSLSWLVDLDIVLLDGIHYILGELMIKHRINLMQYWKILRTTIIEEFVIRLNLFEVDYVQLFLILPIRLICIVAMIITNGYMIASFLNGMQESGSVAGTSLSTAANFVVSAMYGKLFWKEPMNGRWCVGFACVLLGVVILSNVQSANINLAAANSASSNAKKKGDEKAKSTKMKFYTAGKNRNIYPSSSPATTKNITKDKVSSLRKSFTDDRFQQSTTNNISKPSSPERMSRKTKLKGNLKTESTLKQYYSESSLYDHNSNNIGPSSLLINRSFLNECALCDGPLFDKITGISTDAIADLSTHTCFHLFHAKCLKQARGNACPLCEKPLAIWISSKQAAHFPGFWLERVERYLHAMGKAPQDHAGKESCLPASMIRNYFLNQEDILGIPCLTKSQKEYIKDDPTGMGKGLEAALEWGGYVDYNEVPKDHKAKALRSRGIFKYDKKKDDIWLYEWGKIHPRQRCDQCQLGKRPLPVECPGCQGSAEAAFYCSESCAKRDKQRHKQTCEMWKNRSSKGPN